MVIAPSQKVVLIIIVILTPVQKLRIMITVQMFSLISFPNILVAVLLLLL